MTHGDYLNEAKVTGYIEMAIGAIYVYAKVKNVIFS